MIHDDYNILELQESWYFLDKPSRLGAPHWSRFCMPSGRQELEFDEALLLIQGHARRIVRSKAQQLTLGVLARNASDWSPTPSK